MTVKEFIKLYEGTNRINVELYDINENVYRKSDTEELLTDDGLYKEWKNAEIEGWNIDYDTLYLSVIK